MTIEGDSAPSGDPGVTSSSPKARRRGVRLWVVMAIVPVVAALTARRVNRAHAQKRAVEAVQEAGGQVRYDYAYRGGDAIAGDFERVPGGKLWAPDWLAKSVGDEYFQEVATVSIRPGRPVPLDQLIGPLQGLDRLRVLEISTCGDQALGLLKKLDRVQGFNIGSGAQITDAGLRELRDLSHLRYLNISKSQITDAGLTFIEGLENLEYLHLDESAITDAGLVHLRGLRRLRSLSLRADAVGGDGLAVLRDLPNLETLMLQQTRIGDKGLVYIMGLKRLRYLDLSSTSITDSGLVQLEGLENLRDLLLGGDKKVTPAAVAALQAKLPKLTITR